MSSFSPYGEMEGRVLPELEELGLDERRAKEIVKNAATQYQRNGRYRKDDGVTEDMHEVLRSFVKPYAEHFSRLNGERIGLIKKGIGGGLSDSEQRRLSEVTEFVDDYVKNVIPLSTRRELMENLGLNNGLEGKD